MLKAEKAHRAHAIVEQVIADLKNGPLAHLPSGSFAANSAWVVCAAMAFNLTRTAGALASVFHAKATTGTLRAQLINVPARLARSARRLVLHLPHRLALGHGLEPDGQRRPARTPRRRLTRPPHPSKDQPEHHVETPASPAPQARPEPSDGSTVTPGASAITGRWIRAKALRGLESARLLARSCPAAELAGGCSSRPLPRPFNSRTVPRAPAWPAPG